MEKQKTVAEIKKATDRKVQKIMNWHQKMYENRTIGQRIADSVASGMGSWRFIIIQTIIVAIWMILNVIALIHHWDPFPFILLNLVFSTQAAYAAPIIMMSQNRAGERDREQAKQDFETNIAAKEEIEALMKRLDSIEENKLNKILSILEERNIEGK